MEHPKISIITVCYNAVSCLEETMLSVINQSYDNKEANRYINIHKELTLDYSSMPSTKNLKISMRNIVNTPHFTAKTLHFRSFFALHCKNLSFSFTFCSGRRKNILRNFL